MWQNVRNFFPFLLLFYHLGDNISRFRFIGSLNEVILVCPKACHDRRAYPYACINIGNILTWSVDLGQDAIGTRDPKKGWT
jgi:hypothetical protein